MKRFFKKTVVTIMLAGSMIFTSACSLFDQIVEQLPTIEGYSIVLGDEVYDTSDQFTLNGIRLVLQMSDDTSVTINLTDEMLKSMPDMTTPGVKTIVIEYLGQEYTFNINVAEVPTIEQFSFVQGNNLYVRANEFTLNGTSLVFQMSDDTTMTIELNDSMLKNMPDMTTAGQKTVVIEYLGQEFQFTINVLPVEGDAQLERLQEILAAYQAGELQVSSINASADYNLFFQFLQDQATQQNMASGNLSTEAVMNFLSGIQDGQFTYFYDVLMDSIVKSSLDINALVGVSDDDKTSQYISKEFLSNILMNIGSADYQTFINEYKEYAINKIIEQTLVVNSVAIEEMFSNIVREIPNLSEQSYLDLTNILYINIYENMVALTPIDPLAIVLQFKNVIANDMEVGEVEQTAYLSILTSLEENASYILSDLIRALYPYYNYSYYYTENNETYYGMIELEQETQLESLVKADYFNAIADAIHVFELLSEQVTNRYAEININEDLNNLKLALQDFKVAQDTIKSWNYGLVGHFNEYFNVEGALDVIDSIELALASNWQALDEKYNASTMAKNTAIHFVSSILANMEANSSEEFDLYYNDLENYLNTYFEVGSSFELNAFLDGLRQILPTFDSLIYLEAFDYYGTPLLLSETFLNYYETVMLNGVTDPEMLADLDTFSYLVLDILGPIDFAFVYSEETRMVTFNPINPQQMYESIYALTSFYEEITARTPQGEMFYILNLLINPQQSMEYNVKDLISAYEAYIAQFVADGVSSAFHYYENEEGYSETFLWASDVIESYLYNELDLNLAASNLYDIIRTYAPIEVQNTIDSVELVHSYLDETLEATIINALADNRETMAYYLTGAIGQGFGFIYSEQAFDDLYGWALSLIDNYISGQVNLEATMSDFLGLVDAYGSSNTKAMVYSVAAAYAFTLDDVDYNALLANVELPEQIAEIDFNLLVAKLKSASTYDLLNIGNVIVETVYDEFGNLEKEIITLTVTVDFDIMISQIDGELNLVIELNY